MKFTQACAVFVEIPELIEPIALPSSLEEIEVALEFDYKEHSHSATITIDVSRLYTSIQKFIFKVERAGDLHFSTITLFKHGAVAPEHSYQNLGDMYPGYCLFNVVYGMANRMTDTIIADVFDEPKRVQTDNTWTPVIKYGPELRRGMFAQISNIIKQLAGFMPSANRV